MRFFSFVFLVLLSICLASCNKSTKSKQTAPITPSSQDPTQVTKEDLTNPEKQIPATETEKKSEKPKSDRPTKTPVDSPTVDSQNPTSELQKKQPETLFDLPFRGIVFSGVSPFYSSSIIYYLDFTNNQLSTISTGESGDPIVFSLEQKIYLFNRSPNNSNFRIFTPPDFANRPEEQLQSLAFKSSDPHDAIYLNDNQLLLANYNEGTLSLMDTKNGNLLNSVSDLRRLGGSPRIEDQNSDPMRPEILHKIDLGPSGNSIILVVEQGLNLGEFKTNGRQSLHTIFVEGNQIKPFTWNSSLPSQIELAGSLPAVLEVGADQDHVYLGSLCQSIIETLSKETSSPCHSAIELVDLKRMQVVQSWDLDQLGYYMDDHRAFINSEKRYMIANVIDTSDRKMLVRLDFSKAEVVVDKLYDFPANDTYPTFSYEPKSEVVFIGEQRANLGGGRLTILELNSGERREFEMEFMPYSYAFVPF